MFVRRLVAAVNRSDAPTLLNPWPVGSPSVVGSKGPAVGAVAAGSGRDSVGVGVYRGSDDTVRKMVQYATGPEGERDFTVRQWAEAVIRHLRPKDYLSEILALRHWTIGPWMRYTNDPSHVELVRSPKKVLQDISTYGKTLVDCDDVTCLTAAMGLSTGKAARFLVVAFTPGGQFTHVFMQLQEPRSGVWISCDPVAGSRDAKMLKHAKRYQIFDVHP